MSGIALYDTLKKIPEVSDAEAKEAVADVASSREVATKADIVELKSETKMEIVRLEKTIAELETKITKLIYAVMAVNTGVVIAAVGLMIKFL